MPWHTVAQGEWIQKIARDNRISDWQTIYNHPENASLRQLRPDPNLLFPGDRVFVPDPQTKEIPKPTDQRHPFIKKRPKMMLKVILRDEEEHPLASKPWKLNLEGKDYSGTTDGTGLMTQEVPVPKSDSTGTLKCEGYEYPVKVGHLNPIDEISGVQQRLNNLGFDCGPADGNITDKFKAALKVFQQSVKLDPTGQVDQATKDKLKAKHEC